MANAQKTKKLHAGPVVRDGSEPFKHSLKHLYNLRSDKWLLRYVTIRYFKRVPFTFTGQISCISNNGQIRLQYIRYTNTQDFNAQIFNFIDVFHSFWFHYKQINIILYKNKDVTDEILDILKMKMTQSFVYFYDFKALENKNILKIIKGNYTKQYMNEILAMKNGILISTEFTKKAKEFLFDINRPNKHLLLKKNVYLNEQRRLIEWNISELRKIVHNYKQLFVKQFKHIENAKFIDKTEEDTKVDIKQVETKVEYKSYLEWDNIDVCNEIKKELKRSDNTIALLLTKTSVFNTKEWGIETEKVKLKLFNVSKWGKVVKPFIYNPIKRSKMKRVPEQNRYLSSNIKKKNINKQTNRFHHGNKHKQFKKQRKKQRRRVVKKEVSLQFEGL
eukprot:463929_1